MEGTLEEVEGVITELQRGWVRYPWGGEPFAERTAKKKKKVNICALGFTHPLTQIPHLARIPSVCPNQRSVFVNGVLTMKSPSFEEGAELSN